MGASGTYFSTLMPRVAIVFNGVGRDHRIRRWRAQYVLKYYQIRPVDRPVGPIHH